MTPTIDAKKETVYVKLLDSALTEPGELSKCYDTFHDYSLNNILLLMDQLHQRSMTPGPVAGFKKWQALGRQVRRGEKALILWFPVFRYRCLDCGESGWRTRCSACQSDRTENHLSGFTLKPSVFTIDQTDGSTVPALNAIPELDLKNALQNLKIELVPFAEIDGNCQGYALPNGRQVAVNPVAEFPERTLIHEIAHVLMHDTDSVDGLDLDRNIKEMEAEGVAYLILTLLNLDTTKSRGYIQSWSRKPYDNETAKRIITAAGRILKACQS